MVDKILTMYKAEVAQRTIFNLSNFELRNNAKICVDYLQRIFSVLL